MNGTVRLPPAITPLGINSMRKEHLNRLRDAFAARGIKISPWTGLSLKARRKALLEHLDEYLDRTRGRADVSQATTG